jgi:hypothetical protein
MARVSRFLKRREQPVPLGTIGRKTALPRRQTPQPEIKIRGEMKIRAHAESHVVELDDGSQWRIFPGDLATTLSWQPETDLHLERSDDRVSSHVLVNAADRTRVRVIAAGEAWPDGEVKKALKDG